MKLFFNFFFSDKVENLRDEINKHYDQDFTES